MGEDTSLAGGPAKVTVKLSRAGRRRLGRRRRRLGRLRRATVTLEVTIKDGAGRTTRFTRALRLKK